MDKFKTIFDIEVKYRCYFSNTLKQPEISKFFVNVFNTGQYTDLFLDNDNIFEEMIDKNLLIFNKDEYGIVLQIIGLYYKMIKNDFETAKLYFKKAIEKNNINAYVSLSTITNDKTEKLNYLLKCYELDNNNELALINLCFYYMHDVIDEEKMFYYANIGVGKKIPQLINNLGVYYANKKDFENAYKYWNIASELDFYDSYFNIFSYGSEINNVEIINKSVFYISLYIPDRMIELYEKLFIDTDDKEVICKLNFYNLTKTTSLEEYLKYKENFNNKITNVINYYKMCKKNMYLLNTNLLLGDLIGKEKIKELAEKAMKNNIINETLQLSNGKEVKFIYRGCNL